MRSQKVTEVTKFRSRQWTRLARHFGLRGFITAFLSPFPRGSFERFRITAVRERKAAINCRSPKVAATVEPSGLRSLR